MTKLERSLSFHSPMTGMQYVDTKEKLLDLLSQAGHYNLDDNKVRIFNPNVIIYNLTYFLIRLAEPHMLEWDLCDKCKIEMLPKPPSLPGWATFNPKINVDATGFAEQLKKLKDKFKLEPSEAYISPYDPESFQIKQEDITGTKQNPNIVDLDTFKGTSGKSSLHQWYDASFKKMGTTDEVKEKEDSEPKGVYNPKSVWLDSETIYWMCYFKDKRYSVIFKTGDKPEDIPKDWPKTVKNTLKRIINFQNTGTTHPGNNGSHLPSDPRFQQQVTHPISKYRDSLTNVIISLNDSHRWTFEQIADWLETLDDQPKFKLQRTEKQKESSIRQTARVDEMLPT